MFALKNREKLEKDDEDGPSNKLRPVTLHSQLSYVTLNTEHIMGDLQRQTTQFGKRKQCLSFVYKTSILTLS